MRGTPLFSGTRIDYTNRAILIPNMYRVESATALQAPPVNGDGTGTAIDQNRWRYRVKPAFPHRSGTDRTADPVVVKLGADGVEATAFNLYETNNTDAAIFGIPTNQIPSGFTLKPVPDESLVVGFYGTSYIQGSETEEPITCVYFWFPNQYQGAC